MPGQYSEEFARYWHDDFNKSHLDNLKEIDGNVLLFDVLRDIWTGVIRKNNTYVMDPVDGLHFVANIPIHEVPAEADSQLRAGDQVYNYKHEDFLDLWKEHVDTFVEIASSKFEHVILNKHYLATHRVKSGRKFLEGNFANIDSDDFSTVNNLLEEMYSYLSSFENVRVNTISRSLMLTGRHVPLFGPFPRHFVPEANALFAENLRSYLLGKRYIQGNKFISTSLERIRLHEDLIEEADGLRASLERASGERDTERAEAGRLRFEVERLSFQFEQVSADRGHADATIAQVTSERDAIRADVERLAAERGHHDAVLAQITGERDASRAEIGRLSAERGHADALLAQATSDRDATHIELRRLADEMGHAEALLAEAARERDVARGEIEQITAERNHFEAALAQATSERDAIRAEVERLAAERGRHDIVLAQITSERDAMQADLRQMTADRIIKNDKSWYLHLLRKFKLQIILLPLILV